MASKNDVFADLFDDFKSGSRNRKSSDENAKPVAEKQTTLLNPVKKNAISTAKETKNISDSSRSFDVLNDLLDFSSNSFSSPSLSSLDGKANNQSSVEDLLNTGFEELKVQQTQKVQLIQNDISSNKPALQPSYFNEATTRTKKSSERMRSTTFEHNYGGFPNPNEGFFAKTAQLFDQGKKFVETQLFSDSTDRMATFASIKTNSLSKQHNSSKRLELSDKFNNSYEDEPFDESPIKENSSKNVSLLLLDDEKSEAHSFSAVEPQSLLLDMDAFSTGIQTSIKKPASQSIPTNFINKMTAFESDSYFEFKEQATTAFKLGDFVSAYEKFNLASQSIPQNHIFQIIIYRNLLATMLKTGNFAEVGPLLDKVSILLPAETFQEWNGYKFKEKKEFDLKQLYKKILLSKCEYLELKENYEEALNTAKMLIELGFSDTQIVREKQRLNKIVNPVKQVIAKKQAKSTSVKKPSVKTTSNSLSNNINNDQNLITIKQKVNEKIDNWCAGNQDDLRQLLATLGEVIPDWPPIDLQSLILPKQCKIYYFKAINKTHPDKISNNVSNDSRILYEAVFMVLNKAWEKFKI